MSKLKNTNVLTVTAMLCAIAVILGFLKIPVTNLIEIRFGSIPVAIGASLFGPAIGGIIGAASDILGYLVKPTGAFFPGFTISAILSGIIFGVFLYRKTTLLRIVLAEFVHSFFIGLILNSLWLSMLYGNGFWIVLTNRFLKELIMFPINTVILFVILKSVVNVLPRFLHCSYSE